MNYFYPPPFLTKTKPEPEPKLEAVVTIRLSREMKASFVRAVSTTDEGDDADEGAKMSRVLRKYFIPHYCGFVDAERRRPKNFAELARWVLNRQQG